MIPSEVRRELGPQVGDTVIYEVEDDELRVRSVPCRHCTRADSSNSTSSSIVRSLTSFCPTSGPRPSVNEAVLDASALLAMLQGDPGAEGVDEAIVRGTVIGAVNYPEVVAKFADHGVTRQVIQEAPRAIRLDVLPFDD